MHNIHLLETAGKEAGHTHPGNAVKRNKNLEMILPDLCCVWPVLQQPEQLVEQGGVQVQACQGLNYKGSFIYRAIHFRAGGRIWHFIGKHTQGVGE